jgi:plastocyanin
LKKLIVLGALGAAMAVLVFAGVGVAQSIPKGLDASQNTTGVPVTAPAQSSTPALNNTATVDIRGHAFNPAQLNVAPGTTVRFVNNDTGPHTATADNGLFDTGVLQPGSSFEVFLDGSGTAPYHCELHQDMKGTVVVGGASGGGETSMVDPASSTPPEQTGTTMGDPASTPPNQATSVYP